MPTFSTVYFGFEEYGNLYDYYFVRDYSNFVSFLKNKFQDTKREVNLGVTNGVTIVNNFKGDFTGYNCAIVDRYGDGNLDVYKITKKEFIRKGMWRITMVLDVFSKYYSSVISSDVLVQRLGIDRTKQNPILYMGDDFSLSEVKTVQKYITNLNGIKSLDKDEQSDIRAYGYILIFANSSTAHDIEVTLDDVVYPYTYEVENIRDWELYDKTVWEGSPSVSGYTYIEGYESGVEYIQVFEGSNINQREDYSVITNTKTRSTGTSIPEYMTYFRYDSMCWDVSGGALLSSVYYDWIRKGLLEYLYDHYYDVTNDENYFKQKYNGADITLEEYDSRYKDKIIYETSTGKYYKATEGTITAVQLNTIQSYNSEGTGDYDYYNGVTIQGVRLDSMVSLKKYGVDRTMTQTGAVGKMNDIIDTTSISSLQARYRNVQVVEQEYSTKGTNTPKVSIATTTDEPYGIAFIPYIENGTIKGKELSEEYIWQYLNKIAEKYGGENGVLLDIQKCPFMLPKCLENGTITKTSDGRYNLVPSSTGEAEVEIDINDFAIFVYELTQARGILTFDNYSGVYDCDEDLKVAYKSKIILTGSNGADTYEIEPAKNRGISGYQGRYNVKPYASIYQVQPIYKDFYGQNFVDTRGLIMNTDLSLSQSNSEWETYKRQNVNYLNSFNANLQYERENLELEHEANYGNFKYDSRKRMISAVVEGLGDVVGGVSKGNAVGGAIEGVGTVVGASIGESIEYNQMVYNNEMETRQLQLSQSLAKQEFNYELGNIKALPENLSKVSGITNIDAGCCYIQVFEPTETEKTNYQKYLNLFGVNVGYVYNISGEGFSYIEGTIAKYDGTITAEEYEELNSELESGRRLYEWQEHTEAETTE